MAETDRETASEDAMLESLFAEARAEAPLPSGDLMARILADAQAQMPAADVPGASALDEANAGQWPVEVRGVLASIYDVLGGWPSLAGLASAALAGVWLGAAAPDLLLGAAAAEEAPFSFTYDDLTPGVGGFLALEDGFDG